MRVVAFAAIAACASPQERVSIADGSVPVIAPPSFEPAQLFRAPVDTPNNISSTFGPRWKTSASRNDFHRGIDYYGSLGQPLFAIGDGVVTGVYDNSPMFPNGGRVLVVEHQIPTRTFHGATTERMFAAYLHCDSIVVAVDDRVVAGQQVAAMGMTGDAAIVHLHFETRVATMCSLEYQTANPNSSCVTGFDPHVHPFLFVGGANTDTFVVEEIAGGEFAVRYAGTRGDLDLDVIRTDVGAIGFNAREGIDATSTAKLDDFDFERVQIVPSSFGTSSETLEYELHFDVHPAFLELRDIYGRGVRFGATNL